MLSIIGSLKNSSISLALIFFCAAPSFASAQKVVVLDVRIQNDVGVENAEAIATAWLVDSLQKAAPEVRVVRERQAAELARLRYPLNVEGMTPSEALTLAKSIDATHVLGGEVFRWKQKYGVTLRLFELPSMSEPRIERDWTSSVEAIPNKIDELAGRIFSPSSRKSAPVISRPESDDAEKDSATPSQWEQKLLAEHPEMVYVPGGEFIMGNDDESDAYNMPVDPSRREGVSRFLLLAAEKPQRRAFVKPFLIDKYEVTNADYKRFRPAHEIPAGKEKHPVTGISWHDAKAYATWAGKRLPTEAEWEKAARGTDGRKWPWGNVFELGRCNLGADTAAVGSFEGDKSPYGVFDMAGNVQEWTSSNFEPYPGNKNKGVGFDPRKKVVRGSYYGGNDFLARCSMRFCALPGTPGVKPQDENYAFIGFRCALDVE